MLRLITVAALFVTASLALSACGGDDESTDTPESSTPTATTGAEGIETESPQPTAALTETASPQATPDATDAPEADACELMTDEFVEEVIGGSLEFKDRGLGEGVGGRSDVCYYHFGGSSEVVVRAAADSESSYESSLGDEVSGIPDKAKWHTGLRTLVVLRAGNVVEVGISPSLSPSGTASEAFDAAKLLAEAMLAPF